MSLPNQTVFIQFHPVVYLVKLNIEMSMATLITQLARKKMTDELYPSISYSTTPKNRTQDPESGADGKAPTFGASIQMTHITKAASTSEESLDAPSDVPESQTGIHRRIEVKIESSPGNQEEAVGKGGVLGLVEELPSPRNEGRPRRSNYEQIERGQRAP